VLKIALPLDGKPYDLLLPSLKSSLNWIMEAEDGERRRSGPRLQKATEQ
jgi:hypothetical protein